MINQVDNALNVFEGSLNPQPGELSEVWRNFGAEIIIGHPTYRNSDNIGRQVQDGIRGAARNFPNRAVALVVSDGSWTKNTGDRSTIEAAIQGAKKALATLAEESRKRILFVATPYEGYAGDNTPGKGSALKMVFDEMGHSEASLLILLDGDLRNDMSDWQRVFALVENEHLKLYGARPMFVTAKYARHFVDASLTRFVVGPLTTLMGRYVPGGISGDIALSANAVERERQALWTESRRRYGTDISTTFDNLADPETVIYEIYLGAKLHDVTDEAKLSVMPGEVIGGALERLLHWEKKDHRITEHLLRGELGSLNVWGSEKTGIQFMDPGYTSVFDVDKKIDTLVSRFQEFEDDIRTVQGIDIHRRLIDEVQKLTKLRESRHNALSFLRVSASLWEDMLYRAVAFALAHKEVERSKRCLNYLYTAAFLEFVKERLADLGLRTLEEVRNAQKHLGVSKEQARKFYTERVDAEAERLAMSFYKNRSRICDYLNKIHP